MTIFFVDVTKIGNFGLSSSIFYVKNLFLILDNRIRPFIIDIFNRNGPNFCQLYTAAPFQNLLYTWSLSKINLIMSTPKIILHNQSHANKHLPRPDFCV